MLHNDTELSKDAAEAIIASFLDATDGELNRFGLQHLHPMLATLKFITDDMGGAAELIVVSLYQEMAGLKPGEFSGLEAEEIREQLEQALAELQA